MASYHEMAQGRQAHTPSAAKRAPDRAQCGDTTRRDKGKRTLKALPKRSPTGHDKALCCDATEGERTGEHIYMALPKGPPTRNDVAPRCNVTIGERTSKVLPKRLPTRHDTALRPDATEGVCMPEALRCNGDDETGRWGVIHVITCTGLEASRDHRWYVIIWPCGLCRAHYKGCAWAVGWCYDYMKLGGSPSIFLLIDDMVMWIQYLDEKR